jgi:hypothetical protein
MDLQERNHHNNGAKLANRVSIRATRAYELALQGGVTPATTQDIGAKLIPYCEYTSSHPFRPIPPKLMEFLLDEREKKAKTADKRKEEEKATKEKGTEVTGSIVMFNVIQSNALIRPPDFTPELFLLAIKYRMHPSLFWFTDKRLRYVTENPSEIPTKKNLSIIAAPEKTLLDCLP